MFQASMYTDGASKGNPGPSSIGVVIVDSYNNPLKFHSESIGYATSPRAEYMALIRGINIAKSLGITHLDAFADNQPMVLQVQGKARTQHPEMSKYAQEVVHLIKDFDYFHIQHIPREKNTEADRCANKAFKQELDASEGLP